MPIASACPDPTTLDQLLHGTLPDTEATRLTDHLENCTTCQTKLQQSATGTIPVDALLSGLQQENPATGSAYWPVIARVEKELANSTKPNFTDTPSSDADSLDETQTVKSVPSLANTNDHELAFLDPSDDPAYLGKLHHFQIARVIGRGGMGIVLEAFDTHLHRSVAVKVLNPQFQANEIAKQRFCREGRAAAAISHEHVVPMYQVAKANEGEVAYLVMQLIDGDTLENRISGGQPLPANDMARIGMQIAAGLSAAHGRNMVHRDIKPANIMIEAETDRVKLTDFGLARASDDVKLTKTGMVTGTPLYMSPEQTVGETADERSDLFSLGAVLYEMATGLAPFQAPSAIGVMQRIVNLTPEPPHKVNATITRPLSDLIMTLLQKKPDDRPESAADVTTALASIVSGYGPISPLQVPVVAANEVKKISGSYQRSQRRWTKAAWLVAGLAIALAAISFYVLRPDPGDNFPSVILPGNPGTVWSVDFAPDGETLVAAVEDGSVRVWNVAEQNVVKSFNAHRGIVWMVEYHPTRPLVITSGDDSTVKLWDAKTFELIKEWNTPSAVRSVAFSPDGNRVVAGGREGTLHVYEIDGGNEIATKTHPGSILGVDYSHDGKLIASVGSDKVVRVFDAETLDERQTLSGHDGPIYNVKFAPKGPLIASVGWNKNVRVWNTDTGTEVMNLIGSDGDIWGVAFCGDASHLITGEQMGAARVWDLATGEPIATLRGHTSAVHNVSLDPNAHRIATSSRDGTIRVWDMSSLNP